MVSKSLEINVGKDSRIAEYKSANGITFRAKLIGNVEVDELRGKNVAENAMAKLKFDLTKKRLHKTKVNISLKWDGFYVHLSEGGQELLHNFLLEQISFVWKNSTDDRAIGIIISESSLDKQSSVAKFYAYKTERSVIPLIMAIKELFIFKTNDESSAFDEALQQPSEPDKKDTKSAEDLLDLNFSPDKNNFVESFSNGNSERHFQSTWSGLNNNGHNNHKTYNCSTPLQIPNMIPNPSPWVGYPEMSNINQNQFNMSWPVYSCGEPNSFNPFVQNYKMGFPMAVPISCQNNVVKQSPKPLLSHSSIANNQQMNLFSDLIPQGYNLSHSNSPWKGDANMSEDETKKVSLDDLRTNQNQKELKMDFSVLDNESAVVAAAQVKQEQMRPIQMKNMKMSPQFQID